MLLNASTLMYHTLLEEIDSISYVLYGNGSYIYSKHDHTSSPGPIMAENSATFGYCWLAEGSYFDIPLATAIMLCSSP